MTNRTNLEQNKSILRPLDEANGANNRRAIYISAPKDTTAEEFEETFSKFGMTIMVLPHGFSERHYVWQSGYLAGCWKPTKTDKEPPKNPCVEGTENFQQWNEGFKAAREERRS